MRYSLIFVLISVITYAQNDPLLSSQWNLTKIQAQNAWNFTTGSSNIKIAILDNGVDANHPDLQTKLVTGYDVEQNDNTTNPDDDYYHGTAAEGIAAAATNNGIGMAGVGYNCKIMPIQLAHKNEDMGDPAKLAIGIRWAADHGADIICFSGHTDVRDNVYSAIDYATTYGRNGKGCIFVKSAGNDGSAGITYPGKHPKALSVGATDRNDARRSDSSYGPELDVMAPNDIYATDISGSAGYNRNGDYFSDFIRTSAAAPQVAGLAGLVLSYNSSLREDAVRKIICYTADDINTTGFDNETGWGRINAWRALDAISHTTTTGALTRDEVWTGTVNFTGNITVPSGVKLTIISGTNISMGSYFLSSTGGTINIEDGVNGIRAKLKNFGAIKGFYPTIQSALDNAQTNYIVEIYPGTINENVSVSSKNNLTIAGAADGSTFLTGSFTANNCNNLFLVSATLKQLSVNYCSPCTLWCNIEGDLSQTGLSLYASNLYNHKGDVYNCTTGLIANSTTGFVEYSDYSASYCNIYASSGSSIYTDNNWFCGPVTYDFYTSPSGYITSDYCHFAVNPIPYSGNVTFILNQFDCPTRKINNVNEQNGITASQIQSDDPAEDEFSKVNDSYFNLMKRTKDNHKGSDVLKNEMPDILKAYKSFIKKNPKSSLSRTALTTAANSYWLTEDYNGRKSFLDEIINDKELTSLKGYAESMMIDNYIKAKDADDAITAADALMEKYKNDGELLCEGLFKKGLILSFEMNQSEKAAECFSSIIKNYPDNDLVNFAKSQLNLLGYAIDKDEKKVSLLNDSQLSISNHPNPFNPSTTLLPPIIWTVFPVI